MPTTLQVTLKTSTTPWTVNIDQSGNANHVPRGTSAQTLAWQLAGNAATGSFVAMDDPNPGFAWIGTQPPAGVFGTPSISPNGNQLSISDNNTSPASAGEWTYVMRVNVGGTVYSTIATLPQGTNTDPSIKNN